MKNELTNAEHRVLGALAYLTDERDTPPSLLELADFLSIYTEDTLAGLLRVLRLRGLTEEVLYGEQSSDDSIAAERLTCSECQSESVGEARGWEALIVNGEDGDRCVINVCPACIEECPSSSQQARHRQSNGQEVSRRRRNRRGLSSHLAGEVASLGNRLRPSSLQDSVERFVDALEEMRANASDPDWDWPSIGLFVDGDDGVFFAAAQPPVGVVAEQWFIRLMREEFPAMLDQVERQQIGVMANVRNGDGRECLLLFAADAFESDVWVSEIDRAPDGMRYLAGWSSRPELRTGLWWEYIEVCRRALAQFNGQ